MLEHFAFMYLLCMYSTLDLKTKPPLKLKRPAEKSALPEAKKQKVANKEAENKKQKVANKEAEKSEAKKQKAANKENLLAAKAEVCVHVHVCVLLALLEATSIVKSVLFVPFAVTKI